MHLTSMKNSINNLLFRMAFILLRYSVYSSLNIKLLSKLQFIFTVIVYNC